MTDEEKGHIYPTWESCEELNMDDWAQSRHWFLAIWSFSASLNTPAMIIEVSARDPKILCCFNTQKISFFPECEGAGDTATRQNTCWYPRSFHCSIWCSPEVLQWISIFIRPIYKSCKYYHPSSDDGFVFFWPLVASHLSNTASDLRKYYRNANIKTHSWS